METAIEVRNYVKDTLIDLITNDKELFYDTFSEIIEDIAFGKSIEANDVGNYVDEELVFQSLKGDK